MTYKLNSLKTFRDKGIYVCLGMILALFLILLPLSWGQAEGEEETEWYPGMITEDGTQQVMPEIESNSSHERFKELARDYGLDPSQIWEVENKYGIRESVILCVIISETSGGHKGYGTSSCNNVGNVYNTDSGKRKCFDTYIEGLEAIGKTLNNKYLYSIGTLGCLSNAGSCKQRDNNGHRYATSESNWEKNMVACLSTVYGERIDPSSFIIRR